MNSQYPAAVRKAYKLAIATREKAYAPYSQFKVGAAVKPISSDNIYTGCNVENSSYPGTICAERGAIVKMISEITEVHLEFVVIVTDNDPVVSPCGICRQVISEFATESTRVYLSNLQDIQRMYLFSDLLPNSFGKEQLPEKV